MDIYLRLGMKKSHNNFGVNKMFITLAKNNIYANRNNKATRRYRLVKG